MSYTYIVTYMLLSSSPRNSIKEANCLTPPGTQTVFTLYKSERTNWLRLVGALNEKPPFTLEREIKERGNRFYSYLLLIKGTNSELIELLSWEFVFRAYFCSKFIFICQFIEKVTLDFSLFVKLLIRTKGIK